MPIHKVLRSAEYLRGRCVKLQFLLGRGWFFIKCVRKNEDALTCFSSNSTVSKTWRSFCKQHFSPKTDTERMEKNQREDYGKEDLSETRSKTNK